MPFPSIPHAHRPCRQLHAPGCREPGWVYKPHKVGIYWLVSQVETDIGLSCRNGEKMALTVLPSAQSRQ